MGKVGGQIDAKKTSVAGSATAFRFQNVAPYNEEKYREAMTLHQIPTSEGTLYLYREFAEMPERFSFIDGRREELILSPTPLSEKSGRGIFLIKPKNGTPKFVVKKERSEHDPVREGLAPLLSNLTLKEISIARALSKFAQYEDDQFAVRFESPFGYFEDVKGQRFALFEYIENIVETSGWSPKNSDGSLNSDMQQITDICEEFFNSRIDYGNLHHQLEDHRVSHRRNLLVCEWLEAVLPIGVVKKLSRARKQEAEILDKIIDVNNQWFDHKRKLTDLLEYAYSILLPFEFAQFVLFSHGVSHNEPMGKDGVYQDGSGRIVIPIMDFEFCTPKHPHPLTGLWFIPGWENPVTDFNICGDSTLEAHLTEASLKMDKRIEDYSKIKKIDVFDLLRAQNISFGYF